MKPIPLRLPTLLGLLVVGLAITADASAQVCAATPDVCVVPPSTADRASYLDAVVNGDTTATGDRQNMNRIYELQRGEIYFLDADIVVRGFNLNMRAEAGSGARPILYGVASEDGSSFPDPFFDQRGHIDIQNLVMVGYIESQPGGVANIPAGFFRTNEAGYDLTLDGVVMSGTRGQHIRTQSANRNIRITNSLFANMGDLGRSNFGAGKAIDLRDGSVDNLFIQNTTFVNFQDRIIRHRSSTGDIQNFVFDHNTLINGVSYHGTLALGAVGARAQITNNLFVDAFASGADSSDVSRQAEFDESGEVYANGRPKMTWILSEPNASTEWVVANNVWTNSAAVDAFFGRYNDGAGDDGNPDNGTDGDNDIIGAGAPLTDHILGRISNPSDAFTEIDLTLANKPDVMIDMLDWYRTPSSAGGAGRTKETGNFVREDDDFDRRPIEYFVQFPTAPAPEFDASYPTSSAAYTAAAGDCPAGDLNWFPTRYDACVNISIANEGGPNGAEFSMRSVPNPTRGTASIRFELEAPSAVLLTVYDALGREVATLADGSFAAGAHTADWAAQGVAPGLYIVRLQAGDTVGTHRVTVVR